MSGNGYSYKGPTRATAPTTRYTPLLPSPPPNPNPTNPPLPSSQGNNYCARDYGSSASNSNT